MVTRAKAEYEISAVDKSERAFRSLQRSVKNIEAQFQGLSNNILAAQTVIGTLIAGIGGSKISNTIAEFESLNASLVTVTGSAKAAEQTFSFLENFAATTPFQIDEVVGAFIKLKALGLEPSEEALISFGNTASAMGKTLDQFVEAVADAVTGEFERLKEFGIKASSEGEKVAFTFQGVTTRIGKNANEIEAFLRGIGDVNFSGAMERQADTVGGAFSNMEDSIDRLINRLGEAGLSRVLTNTAKAISDFADRLSNDVPSAVNKTVESFNSLRFFIAELGAVASGGASTVSDFLGFDDTAQTFNEIERSLRNVQDDFATTTKVAKEFREEVTSLPPSVNTGPKDSGSPGNRSSRGKSDEEKRQEAIQRLIQSLKDEAETFGKTRKEIELYELRNLQAGKTDVDTAVILLDKIKLLNDEADAVKAAAEEKEKATLAAEQFRQSLIDEGNAILQSVLTPPEEYEQSLSRLDELLAEQVISQEVYNRKLAEYDDELKKATSDTDKLNDFAKDLGLTFNSAFEDAIFQAESFRDVLAGLAEDIARIILRKNVFEPLANSIGGLFGGGNGGGGFFDGLKSLFGFASGGSFVIGSNTPKINTGGSADDRLVQFAARAGETVTVTPAGQAAQAQQVIAPKIINISDPNEIPTAMNGDAGEQVILNIIRRNPGIIRELTV